MPNENDFFQYLRINPDELEDTESAEAGRFLTAAKMYVKNAGVPQQENNEIYDTLIYMIAAHWYDNRGVISDNWKNAELPLGANNILLQLKSRCV